MVPTRERIKVSVGVSLTWMCAGIFYIGLTHATLDGMPFVFPIFEHGNLLFFVSAPLAQSAVYIIARKTPWLLNIYLTVSVIFCAVALMNLSDGGYQYTYWHQGDLLCTSGCNDIWIFSYLVVVQACVLLFPRTIFEEYSDVNRLMLKTTLIFVLIGLLITSCGLLISM